MNSKISRGLAAVTVLAALAGCVLPAPQFAPSKLSQTYAPRTPPDKIELFRSQTPSRKFTEIGAVQYCCHTNPNELTDTLRKKASEVGGDALIGLEIDATGAATASVIRYE